MTLKVYNTLARKKESFKPIKGKNVNLFVCGPTVYDYSHIGHAKTYVQFDIIVKYLRYLGYKVFYLQNITDLDDKIIVRAKEVKKKPLELAREYEKYYHEDMKALNIDSVTKYARATDYIKEIVKQVKVLIDKGYAYKIDDGYYFNLSKFKDYGKLSKNLAKDAEKGVSRIDDSKGKKNKGDFCLWKFSKPDEPVWKTDIGNGRPGWHIEDTAITEKFFGPQYDMHGGSRDLIFPHHEAEIAQMESASDKKPLVRYWLHTGFLNVKGSKMSKSKGNFLTIRDVLDKHDYKTLRFFYANSHYRSPIDFSDESLEQTGKSLERLNNFLSEVKDRNSINKDYLKKVKDNFFKYMDDDFNTVKAFAAVFDMINYCNKNNIGGEEVYDFLLEINEIFDVLTVRDVKLSKDVKKMIDEREKARKVSDWRRADDIRNELKKKGIILEDSKEGYKVKFL